MRLALLALLAPLAAAVEQQLRLQVLSDGSLEDASAGQCRALPASFMCSHRVMEGEGWPVSAEGQATIEEKILPRLNAKPPEGFTLSGTAAPTPMPTPVEPTPAPTPEEPDDVVQHMMPPMIDLTTAWNFTWQWEPSDEAWVYEGLLKGAGSAQAELARHLLYQHGLAVLVSRQKSQLTAAGAVCARSSEMFLNIPENHNSEAQQKANATGCDVGAEWGFGLGEDSGCDAAKCEAICEAAKYVLKPGDAHGFDLEKDCTHFAFKPESASGAKDGHCVLYSGCKRPEEEPGSNVFRLRDIPLNDKPSDKCSIKAGGEFLEGAMACKRVHSAMACSDLPACEFTSGVEQLIQALHDAPVEDLRLALESLDLGTLRNFHSYDHSGKWAGLPPGAAKSSVNSTLVARPLYDLQAEHSPWVRAFLDKTLHPNEVKVFRTEDEYLKSMAKPTFTLSPKEELPKLSKNTSLLANWSAFQQFLSTSTAGATLQIKKAELVGGKNATCTPPPTDPLLAPDPLEVKRPAASLNLTVEWSYPAGTPAKLRANASHICCVPVAAEDCASVAGDKAAFLSSWIEHSNATYRAFQGQSVLARSAGNLLDFARNADALGGYFPDLEAHRKYSEARNFPRHYANGGAQPNDEQVAEEEAIREANDGVK